jgi:hypothetical protein
VICSSIQHSGNGFCKLVEVVAIATISFPLPSSTKTARCIEAVTHTDAADAHFHFFFFEGEKERRRKKAICDWPSLASARHPSDPNYWPLV